MKSYILYTALLLSGISYTSSLYAAPATTVVQAKAAEPRLAVVSVFAYDAKGALLASTQGFFASEQGDVVAPYAFLKNAVRVEVIDAKGRSSQLQRVVGASSSYDLVRFTTNATKVPAALQATAAPAATADHLQLVGYSTDKKKQPQNVSVVGCEAYNDYKYYTITASNEATNLGCPLVNAAGHVVGIVQRAAKADAQQACAIDARFATDLRVQTTSALNADYRSLLLPVGLPASERDALTYIYMLPAADTLKRATALADFVAAYPKSAEGRVNLANFYAEQRRFTEADATFGEALKLAADAATKQGGGEASTGAAEPMTTDAVHHAMSQLYYRSAYLLTLDSTSTAANPAWTFERALDEAKQAEAIKPSTFYLQQQGTCLFALKRYKEAAEVYQRVVADSSFATTENYYAQARAVELSGGDSKQVMALLDEAVKHLPKGATNGEIYLQRAQRLIEAKRYREAVADLNAYELLVGPRNLSDAFYYKRHLCELEARMYQQALDDIRTAIAFDPSYIPYRLDEALLLLRVGENEAAIKTAETILKNAPESADCYKIMGVAYGQLGNKTKALPLLQKALSLGDETVKPFIEKYKK